MSVTVGNGMPVAITDATGNIISGGNTQGSLLASAARTGTADSPIQTNPGARGVILYLNITAITGGPGLGIQYAMFGVDPVSGVVTQLSGASGLKTATGLTNLAIYPGLSGAGTSNMVVPRSWLAHVFVSDATPYTYSLGYALIV